MKPLLCFHILMIVFSNVLIFVRSQSGTTCLRGEAAKKLNDRFIKEHNEYRSRHGAPPLEADSSLIEDSTKWSEHMTNTGTMEHSEAKTYGENLYMSTNPALEESKIDAVQRWYDEIKLYSFENPGFSMETGHFTQVVWKSSHKIGCGACAGEKGTFVTCRYTPAGNFGEEFKENVLPLNENAATGSGGPKDTRTTSKHDGNTESYTQYSDGQPTHPDTGSTIEPTEHSDTYSKVLKIALFLISFVIIVVSLVPVAILSSMIYKSARNGHRPINN